MADSARARALADDAVRADKLARIDDGPVAPLNALVRRWRQTRPGIPWFDPDDGGVNARVLVLMESPSPRTVRAGAAGFCSEDNDDVTAAVFRGLRIESGLARASYVRWNICPWAVSGPDGHWAAPTDADLAEASPALGELLTALPHLTLTICLGARALAGFMRHLTLTDVPVLPLVLGVPHPSQRNTHARAEALTRIGNALRQGARVAGSGENFPDGPHETPSPGVYPM